jgi:hypothetical protein
MPTTEPLALAATTDDGSLILQRHLRYGGRGVVESVEDAGPAAGGDPAAMAAVDGAPGTVLGRERPPGGVGAEDPEHASEHETAVAGRSAGPGAGREERLHARPGGIGQFGERRAID